MIVVIISLLVLGLFFATWFGEDLKSSGGSIALLIAAIGCIMFAVSLTYDEGRGWLEHNSPRLNAVYETVASAPDGNGKYAAILRTQDGDLVAYLLERNPPPVFKVVRNATEPFQSFPATSPTPSVLPTK